MNTTIELIETIADDIIAAKRNARHPVSATYSEILRHPTMRNAIIDAMRSLAIKGKYKASLTLNKDPMLLSNET